MNAHPICLALTCLAFAAALPAHATAQGKEPAPFLTARGTVAEVRLKDNQIVLKGPKGDDLHLTLDERTMLQYPQANAKIDQLKEGMRVRVTYYVKDGKNRLLTLQEPQFSLAKIQKGINMAFFLLKSASFKQRDEYVNSVKIILKDLDENIDALEAKADKANAQEAQLIQQDIGELKKQRETLTGQLAKASAATAETWDDARKSVNAILENVQRVLDLAQKRPLNKIEK